MGLLCKRRTAKQEDALAVGRYESLLAQAATLDAARRRWYEKLCWWCDVTTKEGADIFVIAPRGPQGQADYAIDLWDFVAYCVSKMHERVVGDGKRFAVVWVQLNNHRFWQWGLRWLLQGIDPSYHRHLEALHVVHPSWAVRFLRLCLWPIAEESLWSRFHAHERIEFLETAIDMKAFRLPKDIYTFDKYLDTQAKEMQDQAAKKFGSGSMPGAADVQQGQDTKLMEEYQKLVEQRGKDAKMD